MATDNLTWLFGLIWILPSKIITFYKHGLELGGSLGMNTANTLGTSLIPLSLMFQWLFTSMTCCFMFHDSSSSSWQLWRRKESRQHEWFMKIRLNSVFSKTASELKNWKKTMSDFRTDKQKDRSVLVTWQWHRYHLLRGSRY